MQPLLVVALVCLLPSLGAQTPVCAVSVERLVYPTLARQARVQGVLKVHFTVVADGRAIDITHEGSLLLAAPAEYAIKRTRFGPICIGSMDLVYRFILEGIESDETKTTVAFHSPNEYFVISSPTVLTNCCIDWPGRKKSWIKRLFTGL